MFCTACGFEMTAEHRYCARCGKPARDGQYEWGRSAFAMPPVQTRLERDVYNQQIAGVCAGLAKWLNWDVTVMRLVWIVLVFLTGLPLIAYPICWAVMPRNDVRQPYGLPAPS